jgi:hypothetical protein
MAHHRTLDDIVNDTEHVHPVHPIRALFEHHFYLDGWVSNDGGLSLVMLNALLIIPVVLALMFYPFETMVGVGAALLVGLVAYEGYVLWRRHGRRVRI